MSNRLSISRGNQNSNKSSSTKVLTTAIVFDVILDESHERLKSDDNEIFGDWFSDGVKLFKVGGVVARPLHDRKTPNEQLPIYLPYNQSITDLPVRGETVEILRVGNTSYYQRVPGKLLNKGTATKTALENLYSEKHTENQSDSYSTTSQTGTSTSTESDEEAKFGEYFKGEEPVNKLKLYEGDKVIQSRFGQSIRFSSYNNEENIYAPTILIRNRQNDKSLDELKEGDITEENVIEDGSTIAITSGDYLLEFTPGTEDTPFETEPVYQEPPSELKGTDQILINSGRIILSSKDSEMIFFSKGDISFLTDGKLTIDNGNDGAFIDLNGEYRTTTNDNNMYFLGGSGEIYLNTEETSEPLARGQTLIDILSEILDELQAEIHPTPAGPSSPPTNAAKYAAIQGKLDTILSTLNYTE